MTRAAGERLLRYLSQVAVNGPDPALGATGPHPTLTSPTLPKLPLPRTATPLMMPGASTGSGNAKALPLREVFVKQGEWAGVIGHTCVAAVLR